MLARRYEFYVRVAKTISHLFAVLTREILFLPLEHKIHIFSPPCNILYVFNICSFFSFFVSFTGALLSVINDVKDDQLNAEDNVLKQVKGLHNKASLIAQDAMPFLQQSSPEYYQKFKKQVSYPWSNFKPFTNKKLSAKQHNSKPQKREGLINFNEETSDRCMTELTGTAKGSAFGQPCQISDECWDLMLPASEGTQGYTLTHQALFFQLGEIQGRFVTEGYGAEKGLVRMKNVSNINNNNENHDVSTSPWSFLSASKNIYHSHPLMPFTSKWHVL